MHLLKDAVTSGDLGWIQSAHDSRSKVQSMSGARQSGDLSGAQKAFSSLAPRGSQGLDTLA
ncbi:hypothetical protein D9623_00285 [Azospirillum brasilense]|uniref:Uncharacterized protein n=1 Tax=Azospirillum brasilense TaxID=192 RepID=A0A0P0EFA4_AZOBR|nr:MULTISPECIES: hypothetical protein [Azospirillum]ALJ34277.1 hypothetical protein AMK58_01925 [Azospirillum brasilense]MDW7552734.1 hypothetical protein [Azospirillum brasilense]MDW7592074.1 hypothetical protein [Azospirillum brasilense]MDW7627649.1 hypothetical protein [Azospirillum brasilense]MDX5952882.1 hypothetical protein [Azospirillum brasilense]